MGWSLLLTEKAWVGFFLSSEVVFGPLHVGCFKNVGLWLTDLWWSHHGAFFGPEYEREM